MSKAAFLCHRQTVVVSYKLLLRIIIIIISQVSELENSKNYITTINVWVQSNARWTCWKSSQPVRMAWSTLKVVE